MPTTERPKSRLDDGRVNPAYTAWRKANIVSKANAPLHEVSRSNDLAEVAKFYRRIDAGDKHLAAKLVEKDFQSAAEPEQTNNDDPREPEVAPALENPLPVEVDSEAGSSPAPADGETITITVDRIARNKSFVYGALNGELVPIRVKKNTGPKLVGKPIPVLVTHEAGHTIYTHAP